MLRSSPTQVLVSNSSSLGSLEGCTINITYLNDTMIPAALAVAAEQAHVYVSTATRLTLLSVTVIRVLHLEGCFIAIAGNNSGSIGSLEFSALSPASSIVTRFNAITTGFDPAMGTSIIRLALGCPPIDFIVILLNATNVTGSMVNSVAMAASSFAASSFALIDLDNTSAQSRTPVPTFHHIVMQSIVGEIFSLPLLVVTVYNGLSSSASRYPMLNGTMTFIDTSISSVTTAGSAVLQLTSPAGLHLTFLRCNLSGYVLYALFSLVDEGVETESGSVIPSPMFIQMIECTSSISSAAFFNIAVTNASSGNATTTTTTDIARTAGHIVALQGNIHARFVAQIECVDSNFTLDTYAMLMEFSVAVTSSVASYIPVSVSFRRCVFELLSAAVRIVGTTGVATTISNVPSPLACLANSLIELQSTNIHQFWKRYTIIQPLFVLIYPPMPFFLFYDVINSTISLEGCTIVVDQVETPFSTTIVRTSPSALLMDATGVISSSLIVLRGVTVEVIQNATFPALNTTLLNFTVVQLPTVTILLKQTTVTNLFALMNLPTLEPHTTAAAIQVSIGCGCRWCAAPSVALSSSFDYETAHCSPFTSLSHIAATTSTTQLSPSPVAPAWLSWDICTATTSLSRSLEQHTMSATTDPTIITFPGAKTASLNGSSATESPLFIGPAGNTAIVVPNSAQSAVVYASLVASTGTLSAISRGSVPALQRSSAALVLAAMCGGSSASSDDDGLFTSLGDNPLGVHFTIGDGDQSASFSYAAGAAIGNVVVVCIASVVAHSVWSFLKWSRVRSANGSSERNRAVVVAERIIDALLPSSPIPGAVALPYGTLVQPSIAACLALITSDGGGGTVAFGVAMLVVWLSVPLYFAFQILKVSRVDVMSDANHRTSKFILRSEPVVTHRTSTRDSTSSSTLSAAARFLMQPTEHWRFGRPLPNIDTLHVDKSITDSLGKRARSVSEHFGVGFEPYVSQREWFFLVEWGIAVGSGVFLGAADAMAIRSQNDDSGSDNTQACTAASLAAWSSIVFSVLQVTLYLLLRPFRVRLECIVGVAVATLCAVSEALILANDAEASVDVTLAATAVQLVAMLLTILREALMSKDNRKAMISKIEEPTPVSISQMSVNSPALCADASVTLRVLIQLACCAAYKAHESEIDPQTIYSVACVRKL
ncbi:transmembrane protein, putative [Bodo saltans]|uniref:Transmembrane protein, putative n=1 Tax=Bodo saltans TaxID=75058 RepID=A0A0S4J735_BODSA|nr:transmembrane protein, putative [Bodo saltans]|eukprot:CUG87269.1 transmembrane protein, putative [Bodo saltans]